MDSNDTTNGDSGQRADVPVSAVAPVACHRQQRRRRTACHRPLVPAQWTQPSDIPSSCPQPCSARGHAVLPGWPSIVLSDGTTRHIGQRAVHHDRGPEEQSCQSLTRCLQRRVEPATSQLLSSLTSPKSTQRTRLHGAVSPTAPTVPDQGILGPNPWPDVQFAASQRRNGDM